MFKFLSLGSGSSGNCYYFETSDGAFLIDAGVGVRKVKKYFRDYGLSLSRVKAIFITHDHADHVKAAGALGNSSKIPFYATARVFQGINKNPGITKKPLRELCHDIEKGVSLHCCGCVITPFDVPHDSVDNVGYTIHYGQISFCLITDAGCVTNIMKEQIRAADYLVIEANYDERMLCDGPYPLYLQRRIMSDHGHLCNIETARALVENAGTSLKSVWLCHLSESNNHPDLAEKTVSGYWKEKMQSSIHPLDIRVLRRTMPSGVYELPDE